MAKCKSWGAAGKVVTPNGEVYSCVFEGNLSQATGLGYISHFTTCPNADKHRKKYGGSHEG